MPLKPKYLILFYLCFFISQANSKIYSQNSLNVDFPSSWLGVYQGEMHIYRMNAENVDTVNVVFEFLKSAQPLRWTYRMTYNNKKYGEIVKDYELIKPDSLPQNTYLLDEKDGILIENIMMGEALYSSFSVAGYRLFSIFRKEGKDLVFEIVSTKDQAPLITQNTADKPEDVFEVKSFTPITTQSVRFRKVK